MPVPFAVGHGILGLEGIHRLNGFDLNTQTGMPRVELDRITGLHGVSEADDNREPNYAQGGEQTYRSLRRGRTITYEGRILARDLHSMRATTHSLRYAATSGYLEATADMIVRPHSAIGGVQYRYEGRVLAFECDEEQTIGNETMPTAYQRGFVLTFRQHDPRYFLVGADVTASAASGATVTVNNPGNAPAYPVFLVNGPVSDELRFERLDNDVHREMLYDDVDLASGQQLRLDFNTRTLDRVSDGESFEHKRVFADSNWWDAGAAGLNAGNTQVKVTGGGTWSITFAPASW